MSLKYRSVTQSILYLIFFMYVATMHCLNYSRQWQFIILTQP